MMYGWYVGNVATSYRRALRAVPWGIVLMLLVPTVVHGQSFRGEVAHLLGITDDSTVTTALYPGQVLLVSPTDSFPYLQALELRIRVPRDTGFAPGTFRLSVYEGVDPDVLDSRGFVSIAGRALGTFSVLETAQPFVLPVITPFPTDWLPRQDVSVFQEADPGLGLMAIQLVPAMKGIPPELEDAALTLELHPVMASFGGFQITLSGEEDLLERARRQLYIAVDGKEVSEGTLVFRNPGIYKLEARAGDYLDHRENIGIEVARTTNLVLEPREPRAYLSIHLPSVAEIFLDGHSVPANPAEVLEYPPGSYVMMIRVGDFIISRRVIFEANKEYEIGLDLDILIKQN